MAQGIYGVFGVYIFAILFLAFFVGLSIKFSRRYSVSKRYIAAAAVMLASVLTAIHLGVTNNQLDGMNFGSYLSHGFNNITPGGAIFAIPSFVLWNIFQGGIGSGIVLAVSAISSTAFLVTFIVTKQGVNKVIKVKPKKDNDIAPTIDYEKDHVDLEKQVEEKYQQLLQKQSRDTINTQKSALGLDKIQPRTTASVTYDSAVPMGNLAPIGQSSTFVADEITQMSTQAAQKFTQGMMYNEPQWTPQQMPTPNQIQQPQWAQPQPIQPQQPIAPISSSPIFSGQAPTNPNHSESILTEYALENTKNEIQVAPTPRARNPKLPSVAPGQTTLGGNVMEEAKPKKIYKPRRYVRPSIDIIRTESTDLQPLHADAENKKIMLDAKLKEFNVNAKITDFVVAPAITRFEVTLGLGTRTNEVYRLENDFAMLLGTSSIRMDNVDGKNAIGIEVPNKIVGKVSLKDLFLSKDWTQNKSPLAVALGKNINDEVVIGDIGTMPHLLIAGSTGSGKSVGINTILTSLVYRADPADVKLLLVDVKLVELAMYNNLPHMLIPNSIGEVQQAINALKWMQEEMQKRYKILQSHGLRHISQYQALQAYQSGQLERMPYILMVIDEAADLIHTGKKEVEDAVKRLSALGRASGIHLILATQRPSVDVITAVIKANLPVRIGFKTVSRGDSTTIVNEVGCEKLVGRGDMLFSKEGKIQRIQGAFIEDEEARRVMNFIRDNNPCEFDNELEDVILNGPPQTNNAAAGFGDGPGAARNQDPAFIPILRWLVRDENHKRTASIAGIQRQFSLGFGRAGRILDQMTAAGYVSEDNGAKGRTVIITRDEVDNLFGAE